MVEYYYDAWGNHKWTGDETLAKRNPFRYRGYYYDEETGLYFLKSRYYDPQIGRFINIDSVLYLDPETINGLNLYAYCNNNPVMNVDTDGTFFFGLFLGALFTGLISGIFKTVSTAVKGGDAKECLGAFFGGFITGGILGAATLLGGGLAVGTLLPTVTNLIGTAAFLTIGTFFGGVLSYSVETKISGKDFNLNSALKNGSLTFTQGLFNFGIGIALGLGGHFNNLKPGKGMLDVIRSTKDFFLMELGKFGMLGIFKGVKNYFTANLGAIALRAFLTKIFTFSWELIK